MSADACTCDSKHTKNIAIIIISDCVINGTSESVQCTVSRNLKPYNFCVGKVSILPECSSLISHELESLLKQFDFVFAVTNKPSRINAVNRAASNIFKETLVTKDSLHVGDEEIKVPISAKVLINRNASIALRPVIYMQRLFAIICDVKDIDATFDNILKPFPLFKNIDSYYKCSVTLKKKQDVAICEKAFVTNGGECNGKTSSSREIDKLVENCVRDINEDSEASFELTAYKFDDIIRMQTEILNKQSYNIRLEELDTRNPEVYEQMMQIIHIKQAIQYIEECLNQYGPDDCFISFNGGKDCTVLLHLYLTVLHKRYPDFKNPIVCMYVQSDNSFEEVDKFINNVARYYNLHILTFVKSIKDSLAIILEDKPNLKACFMGTRRTDPFSNNLKISQMTDVNWPQVLRVHPILDWHYSDIWDYLLMFNVPYCKLYDEGYTSLGSRNNTIPNPFLQTCSLEKAHLPAYKLLDATKERNGR